MAKAPENLDDDKVVHTDGLPYVEGHMTYGGQALEDKQVVSDGEVVGEAIDQTAEIMYLPSRFGETFNDFKFIGWEVVDGKKKAKYVRMTPEEIEARDQEIQAESDRKERSSIDRGSRRVVNGAPRTVTTSSSGETIMKKGGRTVNLGTGRIANPNESAPTELPEGAITRPGFVNSLEEDGTRYKLYHYDNNTSTTTLVPVK